ncbi:MAG: hypothetical protein GX548_10060 [Lentisphaerae bacterium]|nr:hypothetical protein [Lentisphaerota bacterium]
MGVDTTIPSAGPGGIRRGASVRRDPAEAAAELAGRLGAADLKALVFFASPAYDLEALGREIGARFACPAAGCTTAGEIVSPEGYLENGLVGAGFAAPDIAMEPVFIPSLEAFVQNSDGIRPEGDGDGTNTFGLLLLDGMSMLEERVAAALSRELRGMPLIGGSAGDGLKFQHTHVYHGGRFHENAAVLARFRTRRPFRAFHIQHFEPTGTKLVITEAQVEARMVSEINGYPAAEEYARIVGVAPEALTPEVFAAFPVMLRIGGEYYVRSIQKANADGSLTFFCAIDNGLVLTLGRASSLADNLREELAALERELGGLELVIGCDCILRRLEIQQRGCGAAVREVLARHPFVGFSTYGEQFGGLHVNQTLTGLALGAAP